MSGIEEQKPERPQKPTQIQKLDLICDFGGQKSPFAFYIGEPKMGNNPISNQANWLMKERGGSVPEEAMRSLEELNKLSIENGMPLIELVQHAFEQIKDPQQIEKEIKEKANKDKQKDFNAIDTNNKMPKNDPKITKGG